MRLNFYVTAGLKIDVCFSVSHTSLTVTLNGDEVKNGANAQNIHTHLEHQTVVLLHVELQFVSLFMSFNKNVAPVSFPPSEMKVRTRTGRKKNNNHWTSTDDISNLSLAPVPLQRFLFLLCYCLLFRNLTIL